MNFIQKVISSVQFWKPTPKNENIQLFAKSDKKRLFPRLNRKAPYRVRIGLDKLEQAIMAAENPYQPNRILLHAIYRTVMRDLHLKSQTRTICNKIIASDFVLEKDGQQDDELKKLIRRPWFNKYIKYWTEHLWHDHSLVEFYPMQESTSKLMEKEFSKIILMPREHVHPWSGMIVLNPDDYKGIPYRDKSLQNCLIEIGEDDDLGLLAIAAKEIIYKGHSREDWSRHSEKFGTPVTVVKTPSRNEQELANKADMAANIGTAGWAVIDEQDELILVEPAKADAHKIYLESIKLSDEQISKLITGQTSTADEKSFVGSAEVHERVLNTYILSLLIELQDHINFTLIPFLIRNGYPLQDHELKFTDVAKYFRQEKQQETIPEEKPTTQKKKANF